MNAKIFVIPMIVAALTILSACEQKSSDSSGAQSPAPASTDAAGRCPHEIKQTKCPFCNPGLVESEGFCSEHGVAEALCAQCRPYLNAAFRAKGDWCKEHAVPASQCVTCNPSLKDKIQPGSGHGVKPPVPAPQTSADQCKHTIAAAKCPFCTPELVQSEGFCKEHDIAEALCVKCRPYLEAAFKAENDWCAGHNTPESQCVECNPDLKNKPESQPSSQG